MNREKILLVDDEKDFVRLIRKILEKSGYEVIEAYDGHEGFERALSDKPDVIILDVNMPKLNGFEVCRLLKDNMHTRFIPIIMLTGTRIEIVSRITGLKMGADEYLVKPCDPEELIIRIQKLVEKGRELISVQPLTKLPGSAVIEKQVRKKIENREKFCVCYIDVDYFKAFNDAYGYIKGNEVIIFIGEMLYKLQKEYANSKRYEVLVGHIGGDDFIMVLSRGIAEKTCKKLVQGFDLGIKKFYTDSDISRGHIVTKDRQGNLKNFPLMRISVAVADLALRPVKDYGETITVLFEIKNYLKSLPDRKGSIYLKDRRKE